MLTILKDSPFPVTESAGRCASCRNRLYGRFFVTLVDELGRRRNWKVVLNPNIDIGFALLRPVLLCPECHDNAMRGGNRR